MPSRGDSAKLAIVSERVRYKCQGGPQSGVRGHRKQPFQVIIKGRSGEGSEAYEGGPREASRWGFKEKDEE